MSRSKRSTWVEPKARKRWIALCYIVLASLAILVVAEVVAIFGME